MAPFSIRRDFRDPHTERPGAYPLRGMAVLLLIYSAIVVVAVIACAGPSFGMAANRLVIDGGILLLWLGAAAGYGNLLLRFAVGEQSGVPPILRFATSAALGLGAMSLALLGLSLAGMLNGFTAWALIVAGVAAAIGFIARHDTEANRARIATWLFEPVGIRWLWLLTVPFVVAAILGALVPPGLLWNPNEPHGYDVVEYHLQVPREWYEAGRMMPLHHNVFSFLPLNVEMHFLLAMHLRGGPWAGMFLAQFMHGMFVLLSIVALYGFAKWRSPGASAIFATLALATVPWLTQLAAIAYVEGGLLLFGTLAVGWALRATFDAEHRVRRFALAGAMAGLACGCKLTALPEVLVAIAGLSTVVAIFRWVSRTGHWQRGQVRGIAIFVFFGFLTFSPWLARNAKWAGNPVFPEGARWLGRAHFSEAQVQRWENSLKPPVDQRGMKPRLTALEEQVLGDWQYGYVFLPLVLVAIVIEFHQPRARYLAVLLLGISIFWLGFTHLQGRFFILALPLGAMLLAEARWERWHWPALWVPAVIAIQALSGGGRLWIELLGHLYGRLPIASLLGEDDVSWGRPTALDSIPASSPIILVGDAKVFWYYQIPMSRLHYKTVFDVDAPAGVNLIDAWAGPSSSRDGGWLIVDPIELSRFAKTYHPLPPLPPGIEGQRETFSIAPPQATQ